MEVLWAAAKPRLAARQVLERLTTGRDLAYMTVKTVLDRLAVKGLVSRQQEDGGRAMLYSAASSREAYIAELMLADLSLADDRDAVLTHFVKVVSPSEAGILRDALRPGTRRG